MKKNTAQKTVVGEIDADVLKYTVGDDPVLDLRLAEWDCAGTAAHVTMLSRIPVKPTLFTAKERASVVRELAAIGADAREGRFAITAGDQDCHLAIERTLTERLGDIGKRVHTGRSRNDQSATAIRLFARNELRGTALETLALAEALVRRARTLKGLPETPVSAEEAAVNMRAYREAQFDKLAAVVRESLDMKEVYAILRGE